MRWYIKPPFDGMFIQDYLYQNLLQSDNYCWNYRWWLGDILFETQHIFTVYENAWRSPLVLTWQSKLQATYTFPFTCKRISVNMCYTLHSSATDKSVNLTYIVAVIFHHCLDSTENQLCTYRVHNISNVFVLATGSSYVNKVEDTEDSKPKDGRRWSQ